MHALNLPTYDIKLIEKDSGLHVFDIVRKKYLLLTPEEWVRQNFIHFLIHDRYYPISLLAVEMTLQYGALSKRADIVLYNSSGNPVMIVECKAPNVKISQKTIEQVSMYNVKLKVQYLIVTNGMQHYCCKLDYGTMSYVFVEDIPEYQKLLG